MTIPLPGLEESKSSESIVDTNFRFPSMQTDQLQTISKSQLEPSGSGTNVQNPASVNNYQKQNLVDSIFGQTNGIGKSNGDGIHGNQNVPDIGNSGIIGSSNDKTKETSNMLYALSHMSGLQLLQYLGMKTPPISLQSNSATGGGRQNEQQTNQLQPNYENQNSHSINTNNQNQYVSSTGNQQQNNLQQTVNNNQQTGGAGTQGVYNPNTINHEQLHTSPVYMMTAGQKGQMSTSYNGQATAPNQNAITGLVTNKAKTNFDPDQLMHSMMTGNESPFNPNTYNVKQNYIEAHGWNSYTGKSPGNGTPITSVQGQAVASGMGNTGQGNGQTSFNPDSLNGAKMNFSPMAIMMSPGESKSHSNIQFTFNPDKLNTFGAGFKPGQISPVKISQMQLPSNNDPNFLFNADNINKKLTDMGRMTFVQQQQQQQQQNKPQNTNQQAFIQNAYSPNKSTGNGMFFPGSFVNQGKSGTSHTKEANHNMQISTSGNGSQQEKQGTVSKGDKSSTTQDGFPTLQSASAWGSMPGNYDKLFGDILFNADAVNAQQRQFDPEKVMQSWFEAHSITINGKASPAAQLQQNELRRPQIFNDDLSDDVANVSTSVTLPPASQSTPGIVMTTNHSVWSTVSTTNAPPSTMTTPTTTSATNSTRTATLPPSYKTTPITTPKSTQTGFNPDAINSAIGQMNFSPGNILGYGQPPSKEHNSQYSTSFNPDSVNTVNFNSGGLNMMQNGFSNGFANSGTLNKNDSNQAGFGMFGGGAFNPSTVNQASMNFDLKQQMGFPSGSNGSPGAGMFSGVYDPMKTNFESVQSPFVLNSSNNSGSSGFFSAITNSLSPFSGSFDPNKVNKESIEKGFGLGIKTGNGSSNFFSGGDSFMKQFLGMGSGGGVDNSAFIGHFDQTSVNNAVFNPNTVNNVHMNFDPSEMLEKNPGYDKTKAEKYTFDANKINNLKLNSVPPFLSQYIDPNKLKSDGKNGNKTDAKDAKSKSEFVPGLLTGGVNYGSSFNPNTANNNVVMHFSPIDMTNSVSNGNGTSNQSVSTSNGNGITFDPVAVNNGQMNFNPSSMMGKLPDHNAQSRIGTSETFDKDAFPFMGYSNSDNLYNNMNIDGSRVFGGDEND